MGARAGSVDGAGAGGCAGQRVIFPTPVQDTTAAGGAQAGSPAYGADVPSVPGTPSTPLYSPPGGFVPGVAPISSAPPPAGVAPAATSPYVTPPPGYGPPPSAYPPPAASLGGARRSSRYGIPTPPAERRHWPRHRPTSQDRWPLQTASSHKPSGCCKRCSCKTLMFRGKSATTASASTTSS